MTTDINIIIGTSMSAMPELEASSSGPLVKDCSMVELGGVEGSEEGETLGGSIGVYSSIVIVITRVYPWKFHGLVNLLCSFRS